VDADGDELGLGNRTPSKEIPLTSSFTTSCGSPVDEFSVSMKTFKTSFHINILAKQTFADDLKLHSIQHRRAKIIQTVL
jgi:hypothetical protein